MATAELLDEIYDPKYAGKADAEIVAALNELHTENTPCPAISCKLKLDSMLLPERCEAAHKAGKLDDATYARCLGWFRVSSGTSDIDFAAEPLRLNQLIAELEAAGVIAAPEPTWLLDLGRRQWTIGRKVLSRDIAVADITAAKALKPLHDSVKNERATTQADYERRMANVQAAYTELNKLDDALKIVGSANYKPAWVK